MGRKGRRLRQLEQAATQSITQTPAQSTSPIKAPSQFRLLEKRFKRFIKNPNDLLPNVDMTVMPKQPYNNEINGVYLIRKYLTLEQQKQLVRLSLQNTNISNLDAHYTIPTKDSLWSIHERAIAYTLVSNDHVDSIDIKTAIRKIRWKILGTMYNWEQLAYESSPPLPIPDFISSLVLLALDAANLNSSDYTCQAGIINFYGLQDTLMAHQDKSEKDSLAPLVSFSIGHSCIFLVGTDNRNDIPIPIILESGDALILYGAARRFYHGVPRILENTCPIDLYPSSKACCEYIEKMDPIMDAFRFATLKYNVELLDDSENAENWDIFGTYMLESRININIRKVD